MGNNVFFRNDSEFMMSRGQSDFFRGLVLDDDGMDQNFIKIGWWGVTQTEMSEKRLPINQQMGKNSVRDFFVWLLIECCRRMFEWLGGRIMAPCVLMRLQHTHNLYGNV